MTENLLAIVVAPSIVRSWSAHAALASAMDIHFGPGQVLTCQEDQVEGFVQTLTERTA